MELTNIRDLFRDKEMYLDKEISVGGWVRSVRGSKTFGFIVVNDGTFLNRYRSFTVIIWRILQKFQN